MILTIAIHLFIVFATLLSRRVLSWHSLHWWVAGKLCSWLFLPGRILLGYGKIQISCWNILWAWLVIFIPVGSTFFILSVISSFIFSNSLKVSLLWRYIRVGELTAHRWTLDIMMVVPNELWYYYDGAHKWALILWLCTNELWYYDGAHKWALMLWLCSFLNCIIISIALGIFFKPAGLRLHCSGDYPLYLILYGICFVTLCENCGIVRQWVHLNFSWQIETNPGSRGSVLGKFTIT